MDGLPLDPITLQQILQSLPALQKKKRTVAGLRSQQDYFKELQSAPGTGHYQPAQGGAIAAYQKDYGQIGNQIAGALGGFLAGRSANKEEDQYNELRNQEILRTIGERDRLSSLPQGQQSQNGVSPNILNSYLGMIDAGDAGVMGGNVHSTFVADDGQVMLVTKDKQIIPTGKYQDYTSTVKQNPGGDPFLVGNRGRGRAQIIPTGPAGAPPAGAPPAGAPPAGAPPASGPTVANIEGLNPQQNAELASQLSNVAPDDQATQERIISEYLAGAQPGSGQQFEYGAYHGPPTIGGTPPAQPTPAPQGAPTAGPLTRMPTAAEIEAQKNPVLVDRATQIAEAQARVQGDSAAKIEAQKVYGKMSAEQYTGAVANLPKAQDWYGQIYNASMDLINDPNLPNILVGSARAALRDIDTKTGKIGAGGMAARALLNATDPRTANTMAKYDKVASQLYRSAYDTLRGGGAITEKETEAVARAYGNLTQAQTPEEFKKSVKEMLFWYHRGVQRLKNARDNPPAGLGLGSQMPQGYSIGAQ